jgi:tetratricopeptide (TPR) repeat protein
LSDTYHYIGVAYGNVDDLDKSLSYFKQALEIRRKLLGGDDLRVAETCQKMVSVLSIYWIKVGR